ncbi:MAG: hypothetical protein NVSMB66_1790 [Candidatus Doudnabacteria bacterium]
MIKGKIGILLLLLLFLVVPFRSQANVYQPDNIKIPSGYRVELVAKDLNAPRMTTFDSQGRLIIAEAGLKGMEDAKVIRIETNGVETVLAQGTDFNGQMPISSVAYHDGKIYIGHGGTISVLEQDGKILRDIIKDLPGNGDFPVGQMIFKESVFYFTIGTVTNSGVVGSDNIWFSNDKLKTLHDIPCRDTKLTGTVFENDKKNKTGAFNTFGTSQPKGSTVKGAAKCNGAILRANIDGTGLQTFAYGFRNPYALRVGPDNSFYVTDQGIENRGLRPFEKGIDCFYKVSEGQWYGWPDFSCGDPLKNPVTQNTFSDSQKPLIKFSEVGIISGFDFAPSNDWGKTTDAFVSLSNGKVVRIDTVNKTINDFSSGYDHPSNIAFGPEGAMYITDLSGAVWKILKVNQANPQSTVNEKFGLSIFTSMLQLLVLGWLTWRFARKRATPPRDYRLGARLGLIAGFISLVTMLIIATLYYHTPWFASVQLFNVFGSNGDILTLQLKSFIPGLIVYFAFAALFGSTFSFILRTSKLTRVVASSALYGMVVWAILQYAILPHYSKTIIERSFPPSGFFFVFLAYGLALGYLFEQDKFKELF